MLFRFAASTCRASVVVVLNMASWTDVSFACRALPPKTVVLLDKVPAEARSSSVIARVILTDIYQVGDSGGGYEYHARARIIEAIKGVEIGQIINIQLSPGPCNATLNLEDAGKEGFVAGEFVEHQLLVGFWDRPYKGEQRRP